MFFFKFRKTNVFLEKSKRSQRQEKSKLNRSHVARFVSRFWIREILIEQASVEREALRGFA